MNEGNRFLFRPRNGAIDWGVISRLDVNSIARDSDVSTLQSLVDMVTFADLQQERTWRQADPGLLKVAQLAQLMIEYLHASQRRTALRAKTSQDRVATLSLELDSLRSSSRERDSLLASLKRENRQLGRTVETLQTALKAASSCGVAQGPPVTTVAECPLCRKQFRGVDFLRSHVERRHPDSTGSAEVLEALSRTRGVLSMPPPRQIQTVVQVVPAPVAAAPPPAPPAPKVADEATLAELRELKSELGRLSQLKEEVSQEVGAMLTREREQFTRQKEQLERANAESLSRVQDDLEKARSLMRSEMSQLKSPKRAPPPKRPTKPVARAPAPKPAPVLAPAPVVPKVVAVQRGVGEAMESDTSEESEDELVTAARAPVAETFQVVVPEPPQSAPREEKPKRKKVIHFEPVPAPGRPYILMAAPHTAEELKEAREDIEKLMERSLQQLGAQGGSFDAARYDRLMALIEQRRTPRLEEARRRTEQEVEEIVQQHYIDVLPLPASDPLVPVLTSSPTSALARSRASSLGSSRASLRMSTANLDEEPAMPLREPLLRGGPQSLRSSLSASISSLLTSLRQAPDASSQQELMTSSMPLVRSGTSTPLLKAALTRGASLRRMSVSFGPPKPARPLTASLSAPVSPLAKFGGMSPQSPSSAATSDAEDATVPEEGETPPVSAATTAPEEGNKGGSEKKKKKRIKGLFGKLASSLGMASGRSPRKIKENSQAATEPTSPPPPLASVQPRTVQATARPAVAPVAKPLPVPPSKPARPQEPLPLPPATQEQTPAFRDPEPPAPVDVEVEEEGVDIDEPIAEEKETVEEEKPETRQDSRLSEEQEEEEESDKVEEDRGPSPEVTTPRPFASRTPPREEAEEVDAPDSADHMKMEEIQEEGQDQEEDKVVEKYDWDDDVGR